MSIIENVKEIEAKYLQGQNIFRRSSVGFLLERISQLEQAVQQSVQADGAVCTCKKYHVVVDDVCKTCGLPYPPLTQAVG
jgi:hypothetical protein